MATINPGNFLLDLRHCRRPGCSDGPRGSFPVSSGQVQHCRTTDVRREPPLQCPAAFHRINRIKFGCRDSLRFPRLGASTAVLGSRTSQLEATRGTAKTFNPYGLDFGRPQRPAHGSALPVASRTRRERTTDKTPAEIDVGLEGVPLPAPDGACLGPSARLSPPLSVRKGGLAGGQIRIGEIRGKYPRDQRPTTSPRVVVEIQEPERGELVQFGGNGTRQLVGRQIQPFQQPELAQFGGMGPVNWLADRSNHSNNRSWPSSGGMGPVSRLFPRYRYCRSVS